MSLAPASAAATSATPFSASQNAQRVRFGRVLGRRRQRAVAALPEPVASGSSPASFATVALVFRFCL